MKKEMEPRKKLLEPEKETEIPPDSLKVKFKLKLKAPKQKDNLSVYYSIEEPVDVKALKDPQGFNPRRFVVNILVDKNPDVGDDPFVQPETDTAPATVFDPAVQVTVVLTDADIQAAAGEKIRLALHDGSQWVVKVSNITQAGPQSFLLKQLGDPAIAISP